MSVKKEPGYFFFDSFYGKKTDRYLELFKEGEKSKYRGESSTYYLQSQDAIKRMKTDLTETKFIIILRNPIDRILSHYNWLRSKGLEHRRLELAVNHDIHQSFRPSYNILNHFKNYLTISIYSKWIQIYFEEFGRENVFIVTTEELKSEHLRTMNNIFGFLNLHKLTTLSKVEANKTIYRHIPQWDALILYYLFTQDDSKIFLNLIQKIIPSIVKKYYLQLHYKFTKNNTLSYIPEPSGEMRNWLRSILYDDVKRLKSICNKKFKEWEDFVCD